eukprot:1127536-Alexandrium_andersonii.AAC.1
MCIRDSPGPLRNSSELSGAFRSSKPGRPRCECFDIYAGRGGVAASSGRWDPKWGPLVERVGS